MVRVTRSKLAGQRTEGYHQYRSGFEQGEGFYVRRTVSVDPRQIGSGTTQQFRIKEGFKLSETVYQELTPIQKEYYEKRSQTVITIDKKGEKYIRVLSGKALAIHEITMNTRGDTSPYIKPAQCCMCVKDFRNAAIHGLNLKITSERDKIFKLERTSDKTGCFPPFALGDELEPYTFTYSPIPPFETIFKCKDKIKIDFRTRIEWQHVLPWIRVRGTGQTIMYNEATWVRYSMDQDVVTYYFEDMKGLPVPDFDFNDAIVKIQLFNDRGIVWYGPRRTAATNDIYLNLTFIVTQPPLYDLTMPWIKRDFKIIEGEVILE